MENSRLIIIGAGEFAAVVTEAALLSNYNVIGFADDNKPIGTVVYNNLSVISSVSDLVKGNELNIECFIVAIGNNNSRKIVYEKLKKTYSPINIIHPKSTISSTVSTGNGNVFLAGSVVNANSNFEENNIINSMVLVDHDCEIKSHCHLSQGSIIGSNVKIGNEYLVEIGKAIPSFSDLT